MKFCQCNACIDERRYLKSIAYCLLLVALVSTLVFFLTSCTVSPDRPMPTQVYPDASTPSGHDVYNGGIMDNLLVVDGVPYDTVTPALASKVAKWQGGTTGFIFDSRFDWKGATAIPKATMFSYDSH